jgi:hypothetical protein
MTMQIIDKSFLYLSPNRKDALNNVQAIKAAKNPLETTSTKKKHAKIATSSAFANQ